MAKNHEAVSRRGQADASLPAVRESGPILMRLLVPLGFVLFVLVGSFFALFLRQQNERLSEKIAADIAEIPRDFDVVLRYQEANLATATEYMMATPGLPEALIDRDVEFLSVKFEDVYHSLNRDHGITHLYFHDADRVNLIRLHMPERSGDRIDQYTAREAERTGKTAAGIEMDPLGTLTLRSVRPIDLGFERVGYVEVGKEIEEILRLLHADPEIELAVRVHKDALERTQREAGMKMLDRVGDRDRFGQSILAYSSLAEFPDVLVPFVRDDVHRHNDPGVEFEFSGRTWRVAAIPLPDASGAVVGDFVVMRDVSREKAAFAHFLAVAVAVVASVLAALFAFLFVLLRHTDRTALDRERTIVENEDRFVEMIHASSDAILLIDGGNFVDGNDAAASILGYSGREAILATHPSDLSPPTQPGGESSRDFAEEMMGTAFEAGFHRFEWMHRKADGTDIPIEVSLTPITFRDRQVLHCLWHDLAEQRRREEEAARALEDLKTILARTPFGVAVVGMDRTIRWANDYVVNLWGGDHPDNLAGHPCDDFACGFGSGSCPILDGHHTLDQIERLFRTRDGREIPILKSVVEVELNGEPVLLETFTDISELKRIQQDRERLLHSTAERVKELRCLYSVGQAIGVNRPTGEMLQEVAGLVPPGCQFPETARARVEFDGRVYDSAPFEPTEWKLSADIRVEGKTRGAIEVYYLDRHPTADEGVFLKEERDLLNDLARKIGSTIEKVEATQTLAERERMYRLLAENSSDIVWTMTLDGRFTYISPAVERIAGFTVAEAMAIPMTEYLAPETAAEAVRILSEEIPKSNEDRIPSIRLEGQQHTKDEPPIDIEVDATWIYDDDGTLVGIQGITRDVSARVRTEARLNTISSSALDAIVMMDHRGTVAFWNPAAAKLFGLAKEEVLGKSLHAVLTPERFQPGFEAAWPKFLESGEGDAVGKVVELAGLHKDGSEIPIEISLSSVLQDGEWWAIGFVRDISERKRAESEILTAKEAAERANARLRAETERAERLAEEAAEASRAKSEFLANMSHEIRTPMNGVIGMTGVLLDSELTGEQREWTETIRNSGDALLTLINDILDFSKIEAGKLDLEILDFDLRTTLEDASEILAIRAQEKGLEFVNAIDPDVPSRLRGDPGRIRQVLTNLAGNAIKFTGEGEVVVTATVVSADDQRVTVRIGVRDTGVGIPEEKQQSLFMPFVQADGSTSRKYGGTGLGLSISKQLSELMGGEIGVRSEEGEGSEFWFTVVCERQTGVADEPVCEIKDLRGTNVLIVDDNETNRRVLSQMLRSWDCRFDEAIDGESALARLRRARDDGERYDIAVLDMQMPGMDGEELGRRIVAETEPSERPTLVMLTSMGRRGDSARLREIGFKVLLSKPIKKSALYDALVSAINCDGGRRACPARRAPHCAAVSDRIRQGCRILLAEDNPTNQKVAILILKKLGLPRRRRRRRAGGGHRRQDDPLRPGPDGRPDARDGRVRGDRRDPRPVDRRARSRDPDHRDDRQRAQGRPGAVHRGRDGRLRRQADPA